MNTIYMKCELSHQITYTITYQTLWREAKSQNEYFQVLTKLEITESRGGRWKSIRVNRNELEAGSNPVTRGSPLYRLLMDSDGEPI